MTETTVPFSENSTPGEVVGQRRVFYFNDTGQPAYQIYALTSEDFLNPQAGDEFFHGDVHQRATRLLAGMLHFHYRYSPTTSLHIQPKIIWGDESLAQPMPDAVIANHLIDSHRHRPILDLQAEQQAKLNEGGEGEVSIRAIFEVTSPMLAQVDLETKRTLYARAGVPEYWIIDTGLRPDNEQVKFHVFGYRLDESDYVAIAPQSPNRWESALCRLWIGVDADFQGFQLGDLRTGKALPMPADEDDPSISAQAEANRRAQSIADQLKLD